MAGAGVNKAEDALEGMTANDGGGAPGEQVRLAGLDARQDPHGREALPALLDRGPVTGHVQWPDPVPPAGVARGPADGVARAATGDLPARGARDRREAEHSGMLANSV